MQYHASLITADGAYHCPVGSIRPFFYFTEHVSGPRVSLMVEVISTDKLSILMSPNCSKQRFQKEKCLELLFHNCNTQTLPHFEPPPLGDPVGKLFLFLKPLFKMAKSCSILCGKKLFDMSTSFSFR